MQESDLVLIQNKFKPLGISIGNYRENRGLAISARSREHIETFEQCLKEVLNLSSIDAGAESTIGQKNGTILEMSCSSVEKLLQLLKTDDALSSQCFLNLENSLKAAMERELRFFLDAVRSVDCGEVSYHPQTGCTGICYNTAELYALQNAIQRSYLHNSRSESHRYGISYITHQEGNRHSYRWKLLVENEIRDERTRFSPSQFKNEYEKALIISTLNRAKEQVGKIEKLSNIKYEDLQNLKDIIKKFEHETRTENVIHECKGFSRKFDTLILNLKLKKIEKEETTSVQLRR